MRVLLVSALPPPEGGIATWTERYLEYCEGNNIPYDIVNIALSGDRAKNFTDQSSISDELVRTRRILKDIHAKVKCSNATVVHMNTSCGPMGIFRDYLCVRAAYRKRVPVVLHFHCNVEDRVHGRVALWALKKMTGMASKVLTLNSASKQFIATYSKDEPIIVPNFINDAFLVNEHLIREEVKEVVFVGHVQVTKGSKEILEAAAQLSDIHFTLIGPVADEIGSLPCPTNVSLVGPKTPEEVKQYLLNADLYLFPSYTEGFSVSLIEAMSTGLPAVATNVGANEDMLEGKGGTIISAGDTEAIIQAIKGLSPSSIRKEMSQWSIQKVRHNYLTETVMEKILDIYQGVEKKI